MSASNVLIPCLAELLIGRVVFEEFSGIQVALENPEHAVWKLTPTGPLRLLES